MSKNLGEFEVLVLASVLRLGGEGYGVTIKREIETRVGRSVTLGALYTTLNRLEEKGLVASRSGESTPERGGRAKRHYEIRPEGQEQLEQSISAQLKMVHGLLPLEGMIKRHVSG